jgi:CRP-like cAMP-binding protein
MKISVEQFVVQNIPGYSQLEVKLPFDVIEINCATDFVMTQYGGIEDNLYLLRTGIVQVNTLKGDEERILEFVFPGTFFCAYTSYLQRLPSDVEIVTATECLVSKINRQDLENALASSLLASHMSLHIARQMFLARARREKDFLTLSAEERYLALMQKAPEVLQRIPINKIAKYLGIQPESLSRIRKSIIP